MLTLRETDRSAVHPYSSGEWGKLIRKLRWIGMEQEAEQLQQVLATLPPDQRGCVAAEPYSTD